MHTCTFIHICADPHTIGAIWSSRPELLRSQALHVLLPIHHAQKRVSLEFFVAQFDHPSVTAKLSFLTPPLQPAAEYMNHVKGALTSYVEGVCTRGIPIKY